MQKNQSVESDKQCNVAIVLVFMSGCHHSVAALSVLMRQGMDNDKGLQCFEQERFWAMTLIMAWHQYGRLQVHDYAYEVEP